MNNIFRVYGSTRLGSNPSVGFQQHFLFSIDYFLPQSQHRYHIYLRSCFDLEWQRDLTVSKSFSPLCTIIHSKLPQTVSNTNRYNESHANNNDNFFLFEFEPPNSNTFIQFELVLVGLALVFHFPRTQRAWPVRESNQESATFRLLPDALPQSYGCHKWFCDCLFCRSIKSSYIGRVCLEAE